MLSTSLVLVAHMDNITMPTKGFVATSNRPYDLDYYPQSAGLECQVTDMLPTLLWVNINCDCSFPNSHGECLMCLSV